MTAASPIRRLLDLLQGKPLGHPLHPLLVHAPVGLFTLSVLLDLGARLFGPDALLVRGALYTLGLGLLAAFAAAVTGLADWSDIRTDHPARRWANLHLALNLVGIGAFAGSFILRLPAPAALVTPWAPMVLSWLGLAVLMVSGYLGGHMVYADGMAVGRHRRAGDVPLDTVRVPSVAAAEGDFVPVGYANALEPGETLRAEVHGYVMSVANVNGEFFAFQDFCTHRFAPLSLGRLADGQVECPWHRSCFDVRTGAVRQGLAKVDLLTFPARVVNGVIEVKVPAQRPEPAGNGRQAPSRDGVRPREAVGP